MSRDYSIYKTNADISRISLPLLYVNPQFGFSVDKILRHIHGSPDVFLKPNIFPYEIKEYFWIREGTFSSDPWIALGLLEEGLYFYYKAQAYTSFDKDGNMDLWVSHRFSDIIQYAMDTFTYNIYIKDIQNMKDAASVSAPLVSQ
jgi:hypothetical protein